MSETAPSPLILRARPMRTADLDEVVAIEQEAYPHPWTRGIFADCLEVGYHCQVFELGGELVGYSLHSAAAGEAHLLNLCVAPRFQGQGIGRNILRQVLARAREQGADTLFLEVRVSNEIAQALYESEGFHEAGRRFDYYPADGGREDALIYACPLL
ncbi:MAG TPA: ribosomal-protein-alanine N-acetyltransferase [Chromatiaceae bacterium]|nr:ribosomal-protein-alanine N-acetyltransferase [Chromatiaceae bacterium]